jgi:hypothetical protein
MMIITKNIKRINKRQKKSFDEKFLDAIKTVD